MAKKAAVRYPDFTIVFRKDRNGYEGWFAGKAEAFRKTAEKVDAFFQKKYAKNGTLVDNVRVYNLPADPQVTAEVKAEAPKPAKAKPAKAPKVKREAPVLEPEDFEDTDLDPLALL